MKGVVVLVRQATKAGRIDSLESIPGLLKSLKIPSQVCPMCEATFSLEVRQEEFEQHVLQHFRYISVHFGTFCFELGRNVML
jgi:hypothetical protein